MVIRISKQYLNYLVERGSISADFDLDTDVDWDDLAVLAAHWLENDCDENPPGNFDFGNCIVNFRDYAKFMNDWGKGVITGNTYFVSTDGNDLNPGTELQPWATIQRAADTMIAGDTVIVMPGTYFEQITPANSGLKKAPIKFIADSSGEVILNAAGCSWGFYIDSKSNIIIDGFKIQASISEGIRISGLSNDCLIKNCQMFPEP